MNNENARIKTKLSQGETKQKLNNLETCWWKVRDELKVMKRRVHDREFFRKNIYVWQYWDYWLWNDNYS